MKYALLVIDVQNNLFEMKQPVYAKKDLVENIISAVSFARQNGIKVIFSRHENKSFLLKGTPGYQIIDDIIVQESDIVINKKHPNVFFDTGLDNILKEENIQTVIIVGLISNGCVRDACLSALKNGYSVILLSDVHSTFYKNGKKIIKDINREMAAVGVIVRPVCELRAMCHER